MRRYLLPEEEWPEIVRKLHANDLLARSENGDLPQVSGRETDLKLEFRLARTPGAVQYFSALYARALKKFDFDLFLDLPHGISAISAHLCVLADKPFVTLRKEKGRAGQNRIVGRYKSGQRVVIIDDCISEGQSKVDPVQACEEAGLIIVAIVIMIDREEGWKEHFASLRIDVPVYAMLPLSAVRRELLAIT